MQHNEMISPVTRSMTPFFITRKCKFCIKPTEFLCQSWYLLTSAPAAWLYTRSEAERLSCLLLHSLPRRRTLQSKQAAYRPGLARRHEPPAVHYCLSAHSIYSHQRRRRMACWHHWSFQLLAVEFVLILQQVDITIVSLWRVQELPDDDML